MAAALHEIGSFPWLTLYKHGRSQAEEFCQSLKGVWWCWCCVVWLINSVLLGGTFQDLYSARSDHSVTILSPHTSPDLVTDSSEVVPMVGISNTPWQTFQQNPEFKFDFVTDSGQQRKCPMKRRIAQNCHNRWHLDWQFFGLKINETDCHFTSWKENGL